MSNVTALQEIREDKKKIEDTIMQLLSDFEDKYPGLKIEGCKIGRYTISGPVYLKPSVQLFIQIPWL